MQNYLEILRKNEISSRAVTYYRFGVSNKEECAMSNKQVRCPKLLKDPKEDKLFKKRFDLDEALRKISSADRKDIIKLAG